MARRSGTIVGPLLIVVGLLMLLSRLGVPAFSHLWPFLILAAGAGLLIRFFQTRDDTGLVFVGTLLVLIGGLFQIDQWFGLDFGDHWPFFVLAPGVAMLAMALTDRDRRDALLPAGILIGLALLFYLFTAGFFHRLFRAIWVVIKVIVQIGIPLGLMGLGAWLLFGRKERLGGEGTEFPEKFEPGSPGGTWAGPASPAPPPPPAGVEDAQIEPAEEEAPPAAAATEDEETHREPEPPSAAPSEPAAWNRRAPSPDDPGYEPEDIPESRADVTEEEPASSGGDATRREDRDEEDTWDRGGTSGLS